jgi:hypothetical protein
MKTDKLLITATQVREIREFSQNLTDSKINDYIRETQTNEIKGFLGGALYKRLQDDFDEVAGTFSTLSLDELWNGGGYKYQNYDVDFNGLAWACAYLTYARLIQNNHINITRFGVQRLASEESEDATRAEQRTLVKEVMQIALRHQSECEKFIDYHKEDYPQFYSSELTAKKTSLSFFKA